MHQALTDSRIAVLKDSPTTYLSVSLLLFLKIFFHTNMKLKLFPEEAANLPQGQEVSLRKA